VPERLTKKNLLRLKPETSFRDAALTEPLACVVQGVADLKLRADQRVLVIGSGPIGLMFVAVANIWAAWLLLLAAAKSPEESPPARLQRPSIDVADQSDLVKAVRKESGATLTWSSKRSQTGDVGSGGRPGAQRRHCEFLRWLWLPARASRSTQAASITPH